MSYISSKDANEKMSFLEKVARMYYIAGLSQQEISEQLKIGRSSVARYLSEAKDYGIIQIRITSRVDNFRNSELESRLIEKYKIRDCFITYSNNNDFNYGVIPEYLDGILPYSGILGIGGGRTMYNLGNRMWSCERRENLSVVQLTGSLGSIPETSVTKLWSESLGAKGVYMPAPLLAKDYESKNIILSNPIVRNAYDLIKKVDAAIISIGATDINTRVRYLNMFDDINLKEVYEKSIGDIVFNFYDAFGNFTVKQISDKIIGATAEDYLKIPFKIVVAYGEEKVKALKVALECKYLDVLITDNKTALSILEQ